LSEESDAEDHTAIPVPVQSPLFHALEQQRYTRQGLIRDIEARSGCRLICYIGGPGSSLTNYDIPPFVDLLSDVSHGEKLDLMLQTPGGDVDQAERVVMMCRKRIGLETPFRVVVPDSAKSAGTLIALGADEIVMGYPSELGPIDPQIDITTTGGEHMIRPAQSFLDGLTEIVDRTGTGALSPAYFPLLDKLDPALIDFCRKALQRSKDLAEDFLKRFSMRDDPDKAHEVALELNNVKKFLSHGAVIDAERAREMGLSVTILDPDDDVWQAYWRLYCQGRLALERVTHRLYEGRRISLVLG
jgi:hypothetical protein